MKKLVAVLVMLSSSSFMHAVKPHILEEGIDLMQWTKVHILTIATNYDATTRQNIAASLKTMQEKLNLSENQESSIFEEIRERHEELLLSASSFQIAPILENDPTKIKKRDKETLMEFFEFAIATFLDKALQTIKLPQE